VNLLNGIRVLDATSVLAGPLCTYLLALSGAEVTKVELPATGDFTRSIGPEAELNARKMGASFLAQNAGKHSITLNLKDEQGKDLFRRLSRNCDVVVENFRPGVMAGLGLGEQALRRENPGLIYCSISGFGQEGPLAGRPAYDHVIQGLAGGMTITGDEKTGPVKSGFQFCDTTAAMMAAYAITAALVRRERTGKGAFLDVAMLDTALFTFGWPMAHYVVARDIPRTMGNHNFNGAKRTYPLSRQMEAR
jgi:formyl-CoA transferase